MFKLFGCLIGFTAGIIGLVYLPEYLGHSGTIVLAIVLMLVGIFGLALLQTVKAKKISQIQKP